VIAPSAKWLGVVLRLGVFALIAVLGLYLFPFLIYPLSGYFVAAVFGTFAASAVANAIVLRIFERMQLPALGLSWIPGSARNLGLGLAGGVGAAAVVLGVPVLAGMASVVPDPDRPANWGTGVLVMISLIFGAVGEEMLFRGYPFQVLMANAGRFATILPMAILFAAMHSFNQNASALGLVNTAGFGVVLGYAFARAGDLWMPIGIHLGWNWMLPLFGVNLSGFTMGVTGVTMRWKAGDLWSGGSYGPEASILTCLVVVGLMVYVAKAPVVEHQPALVPPEPEA
jgi:uncharacterized protein